MKHRGLIGMGVFACLALGTFGCGKSDKKPAADPAPATTAPEATAPSTTPPAPAAAKGLAGLFSKKSSKPKRTASPLSGMFGGGINVGAGPSITAAAAAKDMPAAPAAPSAPQAKTAAGPASAGCTQVAAHVAAMAQKEMGADIPASTLDDMKVQLAHMCTSDAWPEAAIKCVLASGDLSALSACESQIPRAGNDDDMAMGDDDDMDMGDDDDMDMDDMDFDMPDLGPSTPVPSGDAKCDKVAAHAWNLLMSDPSMVPADQRAVMEGMKVQMTNMIAAECVKQAFADTVKDCILAAKKIADTEKCGI